MNILRFLCHVSFAVCSDIFWDFSISKRLAESMMNVTVSNKHNTTWKMLCTVFPRSLFLYQKSHSFDWSTSTTRTKIPYARTFHEVCYMYNLCSRRMEVVWGMRIFWLFWEWVFQRIRIKESSTVFYCVNQVCKSHSYEGHKKPIVYLRARADSEKPNALTLERNLR